MTEQAQRLFDDIFRLNESAEKTADYLTRLDLWLAANRRDYYVRLRDGATDCELDNFERHFGLKLPESFRACYRWRDGQEDGCAAGIMDQFKFMPLAAIRSRKECLDSMIGRDLGSSGWWHRAWVPFLDNGNGDHPYLDLTQTTGGFSKLIRRFWKDSPDRSIWIHSFQSWIAILVESYEAGRHFTMKPKPAEPGAAPDPAICIVLQ